MGRAQLEGMLDHASGTPRRVILEWHLRHNHYPPHPLFMVGVAEAAIEACVADEPERLIPLPEGVEHKRYGVAVPASVIVESLHLHDFLEARN